MDRKKLFNLVFTIGMVAITIFVLSQKTDYNKLTSVFMNANKWYLLCGVVALFIYWLLEAYMIDELVHQVHKKRNLWLSFKTTMIGQYYNLITPFSSGGQPLQVYAMKQDNIPVPKATVVMVNKFIVFQVTVTLYSLVLVLFKFNTIMSNLRPASGFIFIGLLLNIIGLAAIIMMIFNPKGLEKFLIQCIRFLAKIKIIKHPEKHEVNMIESVEEYSDDIGVLIENKLLLLKFVFITVVQLTVYFSITYFIYKALGLTGVPVYDIIALQAILYVAVAFIPTPGSVGSSEIGFALILGHVFSGGLTVYALLLWRGIVYYFNMIISGIFVLVMTRVKNKATVYN